MACDAPPPRQELGQLFGSTRPVEGRLTGGFAFSPYTPPSERRSPLTSLKELNRVARRIESEARQKRSSEALRNLALLNLFLDRPEDAVAKLEQAVTPAPGEALLLSDLSASYIARAEHGGSPFDFVRALSAADRAIKADPHLLEARFNRALALEKLFLKGEARQAWNELTVQEQDPGWKSEEEARLLEMSRPAATTSWNDARERLDAVAASTDRKSVDAIVASFPQPARLYAEETLLAQWAKAAELGQNPLAEGKLGSARAIGSALLRRRGDAMVHDAVAAIDAARAEPSPERLQHLIAGHLHYGNGLQLYQQHDFESALPELSRAERELRRGRSPFVHWAIIYLASSDYFKARFVRTRDTLEHLGHSLPKGRYSSLEGRISWLLGSIEILSGRPGDALPRFYDGREHFTRSGELDDLSGMLQHLAIILGSMGRTEEAWTYTYEGLQLADRLQSPRRLYAILDQTGLVCLERNYPDIALYFQSELLRLGERLRDPELIAPSRLRRGQSFRRLNRIAEAQSELAEARHSTAEIQAKDLRRRMESEILTAEAEISLSSQPETAAKNLTNALRYYEASGYRLYFPLIYFIRARAFLAAGDEKLAEKDLRAGLSEIEAVRDSFVEARLRIALQDQFAALFDETLIFLAREGRIAEAFQVSERGHARQLLEELAVESLGHEPPPAPQEGLLSVLEIRRELPPGTVLIKFAALEDRLLVWSLSREREDFREVPIRRADLDSIITKIRADLRAGKDRQSLPELRQAYTWLVEATGSSLADAREIVFIPNRSLHLLPFAALVDPHSERYLVEDRAVVVAPSANVYVRCLRRARQQGNQPPQSALVVGSANPDPGRFGTLRQLRLAEQEAKTVAAAYPQGHLLTGGLATRERFLSEVSRAPEVIHFAGHSVPNPNLPELSMLVFAPDPAKNDSGAVYSHEVYGLRLARTRITVLSACDTANGGLSISEGPMGLVRPFLAAGVPAVIASLMPVEDRQGRDMMTLFHRNLRSGRSAAEALRQAQLSRLAAGGEAAQPVHWASFELIGAALPP
jgi:CHAT domain-containing protein